MSFFKKNFNQDPNSHLKKQFSQMKDSEVTISQPTDFQTLVNIKYHENSDKFVGVPSQWKSVLTNADFVDYPDSYKVPDFGKKM
jgi:predicted Zn-dependent protease